MTKQPNSDQGNRAQRRRAEREAPAVDVGATPVPQQGGELTTEDMVGELGSRDMEIIRLKKVVRTRDAQIAKLAETLAGEEKPKAAEETSEEEPSK